MIAAKMRPLSLFSENSGAWVAMNDFDWALLEYSDLESVHFFYEPSFKDHQLLMERYDKHLTSGRLKLFSKSKIPEMFASNNYCCIYQPHFSYGITPELYARSLFAPKVIPIFSISHDLISQKFVTALSSIMGFGDFFPCDSVSTPSQASKQAFHSIVEALEKKTDASAVPLKYRGRIDAINLAIDCDKLPQLDKLSSRKLLSIPAESIIILYFGRVDFIYKSDLYTSVRLLHELVRRGTRQDVQLIIAGRDERGFLSDLELLSRELGIGGKITFFGNPTVEQKSLLYSASDIFLSLSDHPQESFGLALLEAMSYGLPTIVSDWDGYKEIVHDGVSGFRIRTYLPNERFPLLNQLTVAINFEDCNKITELTGIDFFQAVSRTEQLVENPILRQKFGETGRRIVRERFDWKRTISRYTNLWGELRDLANGNDWSLSSEMVSGWYDLSEAFEGYPTARKNRETNIRLASFDSRKVDENLVRIVTRNSSNPEICFKIFVLVREQERCDIQTILGLLRQSFTGIDEHQLTETIWRSIMVMYKYGLIEFLDMPIMG